MNLPNFISISRLALVPFVIWFITHKIYALAFWVFLAASISDAIDGYLARKFNIKSKLGSFLDPLADKVLLVTVVITFGYLGHIPFWLVALIVARDAFLLLAYLTLRHQKKDLPIEPSLISKFNTAFQMSYVIVILTDLAFKIQIPQLAYQSLGYVIAATTALSWLGYARIWLKIMLKRD